MITTNQIEKLLAINSLPERWTIAQYASLRNKHPTQCVREVTLKLQRGEIIRVDSKKNGYGKSLGIYQYAN
jgi:ABC-type glutathione transport system ATPase component